MNRIEHIQLMAAYNQWMNDRMYAAARVLPDAELAAGRGAFFGSILGTLNHLVVADTIWFQRFASHPNGFPLLRPLYDLAKPAALDELQLDSFDALRQRRAVMDQGIVDWAGALEEADLDHLLGYKNTKGVSARRDFFSLVMHVFNHQAHHRGQASTLLTQAGIDIGGTDLLALIPNHDEL